jgi:parallel beta-helix repeat protein
MRRIIIVVMLVLFAASTLSASFKSASVKAETWEPEYPRIEKTGTFFEINNSRYLNVTITSSEVIYMLLFVPTNMIDYAIESASEANSTTLTLNNLKPSTTYYMYEDSYRNETSFQPDENGSYTYTQDLSRKHHVFIQQKRGTLYINQNTVLTGDVYDTIEIDANDIWLDLNGFSVIAQGWVGIFLNGRSHVTIMNGTIKNCDPAGIYMDLSTFVKIDNVTVSTITYIGVDFVRSNNNTITRSTISECDWQGIEFLASSYSITIVNSTIQHNDIGLTVSGYGNVIYHNNFVDNTPHVSGAAALGVWDDGYPSGGNYWSDYTGVDVKKGSNQDQPGSDGIGDTAKGVVGGVDHYPLMYAYGTPPPPSHTLAIASSPTGVAFTVTSIPRTTPWSELYTENALISLEMPAVHTIGNARYYWNQWNDGNPSRTRTVSMTSSVTLTGLYNGPYYELSVTSSPATGITFTIDGVPKTTPYADWLLPGSYNLEMPQTNNGYVWWQWLEDGDTNRVKTITLSTSTTWTGMFAVETATGSGIATFLTDIGTIEDLIPIDESTLPPEGKPDLEFPHGFFSFKVTGLSPGQAVSITITLPSNMPVGTQYWKCQGGSWNRMPVGDDDGDNIIVITVTDGWIGDADGTANGVIEDPGGLGMPHPVHIPVGGHSYATTGYAIEKTLALYFGLTSVLATASAITKHKTHRRAKKS